MRAGQSDPSRSELKMDLLVGYILLTGTLWSAAFLIAGLLWRWQVTGHFELQYSISGTNLFQYLITDVHQIRQMVFRPRLLINLGIAVLLMTPYLRVLASMIYFAMVERNVKYTVFTGFVFAVLTYSLFLR